MARAGMNNLITRVRRNCHINTGDYAIGGETYWTDDHIQDVLDRHMHELIYKSLTGRGELAASGTIYKDYVIGLGDLEESGSGSPYWELLDADKASVSTGFSVDYLRGVIRFDSNTSGATYYIRARSYNLNAASVEIWRLKQASKEAHYAFASGDQSFSRQQWFDHCERMVQQFQRAAPVRVGRLARADLR